MDETEHAGDDRVCENLDVGAGAFAAVRTGRGQGKMGLDVMFHLVTVWSAKVVHQGIR